MLTKKDSRRRAMVALACGLSLGLFAPVALGGGDVTITQEARTHFQAGVNLLRDPDGARYEEAYREFKAAYTASPSYKILGNLGLCAMKLERDGEAIDAYTSYLAHAAELDPAEAKQVATDLQTLKTGVVKLTVTVDPAGATLNDVRIPIRGERVINQYGPLTGPITLGLRPGHHQLTLKLAGVEDVTWELEASAGAVESKAITLKKTEAPAPKVAVPLAPPPPHVEKTEATSRPVPSGVYVGLVASGALVAAGAITGVMALGKHSEYQSANDGLHVSDAQSLRDQGAKLNLVADVLFGGAVVAAAVTGVLYFSRPAATVGTADGAPRATARSTWSPDLGVSRHGAEIRVRGAF